VLSVITKKNKIYYIMKKVFMLKLFGEACKCQV
jgi:hypothetical protein